MVQSGKREREREREMLRVSEEEGNRKRESYVVESYRQLVGTLLDLQRTSDRIFDTISLRVVEERGKLSEISKRIQSAKAQIDAFSYSEQQLTIKSPSQYPSSSFQEMDFRPLFSYHNEDADEGSSVTNLLVNGGLNREFGRDGTLELFEFFSEEDTGHTYNKQDTKAASKFDCLKENMYLEKILESPNPSNGSFDLTSISKLENKKDELPPVPPSLLKSFTNKVV
ncbi:hypothetical protein ZIOFF_064465 [Zingiber officinale]|uniref:WASH1 WAHD domain-containing protein n=1 Tax=Zingiber officinale TaxID=94328 RepID=A0A8J5KGD3_ZINOF|nr:hypothetical protein ZIOFF_064465 [Zingiber officinale]